MEIRKILSYSDYGLKKESYYRNSLKWKSERFYLIQPAEYKKELLF